MGLDTERKTYCVLWAPNLHKKLTLFEWQQFDRTPLYDAGIFSLEFINQTGKSNRFWFINGQITSEEVDEWIKENDIDVLTEEGQAALILRWT